MNNAEHRRNLQISAMHDMPLLEHVLAFDDLTPPERTSFMEMRSEIVTHQRACLSRKQRSWLEDVAKRVTPIDAKAVPRGREVVTPPVLRNLPKRPPGQTVKS